MSAERDVTPPTIESVADRIAASIARALETIGAERGAPVHFALTLWEEDGIPHMVSDVGGEPLMVPLGAVLQEVVNHVRAARGEGDASPIVVQ